MRRHLHFLGVLNIAYGVVGVLGGLVLLAAFAVGTSVLQFAVSEQGAPGFLVPLLGVIGSVLFVLTMATSVPCLIAGFGLLNNRPWSRVLGMFVSALNLLNVPFGTALGIYGLWILMSPEAEAILSGRLGNLSPLSFPSSGRRLNPPSCFACLRVPESGSSDTRSTE